MTARPPSAPMAPPPLAWVLAAAGQRGVGLALVCCLVLACAGLGAARREAAAPLALLARWGARAVLGGRGAEVAAARPRRQPPTRSRELQALLEFARLGLPAPPPPPADRRGDGHGRRCSGAGTP